MPERIAPITGDTGTRTTIAIRSTKRANSTRPADLIWRTDGAQRYCFRRWGDEFVVHDAASGHTHLLDAVTAETLRLLLGAPLDLAAICARLAGVLGLVQDAAFAAGVRRILERLRKRDLVEIASQ
ncbi:MAG: HPr-rel-A system PqqD family peptide chaperone [Alphaproteobacteria bacterium]|nr:HPr-rel-A system PqqD family peptide chaperone [Alphaproteobacteria bacterium]